MNILVTGGFGFLGGHLVDGLTASQPDARVHVVDALSSNPIPLENLLKELGQRPNLTYSVSSVRDFCRTADRTKWDQVYHLASVVGPAGVLSHAGRIIESIVGDAYGLMDLAARTGARLLIVSSSEVYGGDGLCRDDSPRIISARTTVRAEYAVGKLAADTAVLNTVKVTSLDAVIVRPFNVAGPRQSGTGGFVLPRFVGQAIRNQPLTVFGDGTQVRSFTHVADMADGMIAAMNAGTRGECYNIGHDGNRITIGELADLVIHVAHSRSSKNYVNPKDIYGPLFEDVGDKYPDASKAVRELGWRPRFSLTDIVMDSVRYMSKLDPVLFARLSGVRDQESKDV